MVDVLSFAAFVAITGTTYFFVRPFLRFSASQASHADGDRLNGREIPDNLLSPLAPNVPPAKGDVLQCELRRAGYYQANARWNFQSWRCGSAALVVIAAAAMAVVIGPQYQDLVLKVVLAGLTAGILCWSIPRLLLRSQGRQRVERIKASLPDALDMITMCLSGGISLPDAMDHVSREIGTAHPELALELRIIRQQSDLDSLEHALHEFSSRLGDEQIASMTAMIAHGHRLGTDILGAIQDFADLIRMKRRQAADTLASKVAIKLLFPLTLCLVPSVLLILWGPAVLELVSFFHTFESPTSIMVGQSPG